MICGRHNKASAAIAAIPIVRAIAHVVTKAEQVIRKRKWRSLEFGYDKLIICKRLPEWSDAAHSNPSMGVRGKRWSLEALERLIFGPELVPTKNRLKQVTFKAPKQLTCQNHASIFLLALGPRCPVCFRSCLVMSIQSNGILR